MGTNNTQTYVLTVYFLLPFIYAAFPQFLPLKAAMFLLVLPLCQCSGEKVMPAPLFISLFC